MWTIVARLLRTGKLILRGEGADEQSPLFVDNNGDDNAEYHELLQLLIPGMQNAEETDFGAAYNSRSKSATAVDQTGRTDPVRYIANG